MKKIKQARQGYPELPVGEDYDEQTLKYHVTIPTINNENITIWIYKPRKPLAAKTPCIFIAPAGSHLFDGNTLSEGDSPEHIPYVHQGYTVVAYEIAGALDPESEGNYSNYEIRHAIKEFYEDMGGFISAEAALDYVFRKVYWVDTTAIYTAGHSSAATHALHLVSRDKRFKAAIAYAPVVDVEKHLGSELLHKIEREIPFYTSFVRKFSPINTIDSIACPVFLFYAEDDTNVNTYNIVEYARKLQEAGKTVTMQKVKTGAHYDSMIDEGIPLGICWLDSLCGRTTY